MDWLFSLRIKLLVSVLIVVSAVSAVFMTASVRKMDTIIREQSDAYGKSLTDGVAAATSKVLEAGNYVDLKKSIETIAQSYETIEHIAIYVSNVRVALVEKKAAREGKAHVYSADIVTKVNDVTVLIGTVEVGYYLDRYFDSFLDEMHALSMNALLLMVGLAVVFLFYSSMVIVRPLRMMRKGTRIIGSGDLAYRLPVKKRDEIGLLAADFNSMTVQLEKAHGELEAWNHTLEKKVEERTEKLRIANEHIKETQYQLIQSGKMAAIGLLGAGVAHELNNPLTCILGYSQMMLDKVTALGVPGEVAEKYTKYLSCIERETKRCRGIVEELLHFARSSEKKATKVDMKDVIENTLAVMEYQVRKWNIEVKYTVHDAARFVVGYGDKLQQVIINLMANAHNAMPNGGNISIATEVVKQAEKDFVSLSVTDTGAGIPPENLAKLFDSFFSTKKDALNLGLGLSITKQIIDDHHGSIDVKSEVGKGTSFIILLPLFSE